MEDEVKAEEVVALLPAVTETKEIENKPPEREKNGRYKPGSSGNPDGRPPGRLSLVSMLRAKLAEVPVGEDKKTYAEIIIDKLMVLAIRDGDTTILRDLIDRIDGKAPQSIKLGGDEGNQEPLVIKHVYAPNGSNSGIREELPEQSTHSS